ncbi:MAG: hypothetical protein GC190_06910 [Alphaproteobacteria bacterium]|nr:hypothetical protein [Alphaproteobacteria bacterium]
MRPLARSLVLLPATALAVATARADVAPDPVETTGIAAIAIGALALLVFAGVLVVRYLRARKSSGR